MEWCILDGKILVSLPGIERCIEITPNKSNTTVFSGDTVTIDCLSEIMKEFNFKPDYSTKIKLIIPYGDEMPLTEKELKLLELYNFEVVISKRFILNTKGCLSNV